MYEIQFRTLISRFLAYKLQWLIQLWTQLLVIKFWSTSCPTLQTHRLLLKQENFKQFGLIYLSDLFWWATAHSSKNSISKAHFLLHCHNIQFLSNVYKILQCAWLKVAILCLEMYYVWRIVWITNICVIHRYSYSLKSEQTLWALGLVSHPHILSPTPSSIVKLFCGF
jgi:hypothetical protein